MSFLSHVVPQSRAQRRQLRRDLWGYGMASPWIVGFLVFTLVPMMASLYLSFTKYDVFTPPQWVGLANYQRMFSIDPRYWMSLVNTIYYTAFSVPLSMALALSIALLLNQGLPGQNVFRTIYYMPSVVSGVAMSMLWLWLFDPNLGLVNVVLGVAGHPGALPGCRTPPGPSRP